MSRIQEILRKAEREGGVHRTRPLDPDAPSAAQVRSDAPALSRGPPCGRDGATPCAPLA